MDIDVDVNQTPEDDYMGDRPEFYQYPTRSLYLLSANTYHRPS